MYPARKYEREDGGPGAVRIIDTLRQHIPPSQARRAVETFCRALAYNWVIHGPDAHAKNYSLLLAGPTVRIAPLYDISSVAPYPTRFDLRTMAMAMSVNGKYQNSLVTGEDSRALASAADIDPEQIRRGLGQLLGKPAGQVNTGRCGHRCDSSSRALWSELVEDHAVAVSHHNATPCRAKIKHHVHGRNQPRVAPYRKADGIRVSGYDNPRYRG